MSDVPVPEYGVTPWPELLKRIALSCGLGDSPSPAQQGQLQEFALVHLKTALERDWWPNWMMIEQRSYYPAYSNTTTYALNDIVWDGFSNYYQSAQAGNTGNALADNTAWWTLLSCVSAIIPFYQTGKTPIGTVMSVHWDEHMARRGAGILMAEIQNRKIFITSEQGPAAPWVRFRLPMPEVTAATPDAVLNEWVQYIIMATRGDWMIEQGKVDSGAKILERAEIVLEDSIIQQVDQQGMVSKVRVAVPGAPIKAFVYRGEE